MSSHEQLARRYLSPPQFSFWRWSEDGEVIEWDGGGTIVFRAQLRKIVAALAPDGLPPLNALIMLLAACRSDWRGSPSHLGKFSKTLSDSMQALSENWLQQLAWKLDAVSALTSDQRSSTPARITLTKAIFETEHGELFDEAAQTVVNLLDGNSTKLFELHETGIPADVFRHWGPHLLLLSRCIDSLDLDRLEELERTGTGLLPEPAEIDEPEFSSIRDLLGSIEKDEELAGLARLARHVMAGLTLPKPLTEPDEIPVGGVSDISNRGPFDRLLVSELANDDDVLMTRVALNEALYLRREAPPRSPPEQRIVIFDSGIRMWGVPRLFGTAVGLALGATADKASEVKFLRAEGDQLGEVPLENRENLIEHLEVLRHEAHVGDALSQIAHLANEARGESAMILVTARDAATDPEFRNQLAEAGLTGLHIATVNRQGDFELFERTCHGEKQLAAQKLSIDEILEPPVKSPDRPASAVLLRPEYDPELPAILSVDPFPFRLPHGLKRGRAWLLPGGQVAAITPDGRLMLWDEKGVAARQLSDCLPPGEVIYRGSDSSGGIRVIVRGRKGVFLISAGESGQVTSQWLAAKSLKVQAACEHNGRLMLITQGAVESFDPHSGDFLQSTRIPTGFKWRNDRFFTSNGTLHALSHTGLSPHFEPVFPDDFRVSCTGGFDSPVHGGPVGVTLGGAFVTWDRKTILTSSHLSIPPPLRVADVSFDGAIVVVESTRTSGNATVQVSRDGIEFHSAPVWASPPHSWVSQRTVRTRFREFSVRPGPRLCFWNKEGTVWDINFHSTSGLMVQRSVWKDMRQLVTFDDLRPCLLPGNRRYQLRVSKANDGSRIYVDARGMIHLRSSNIAIPELSFVILDDGELACWSSDGTLVGPKYLVSGRGEVDRSEAGREAALVIRDQLNQFLDHCIGHSA